MANDYHGSGFLTGMLLGVGVGAAAALLFAPKSGEETRGAIRERGLELKSRAEDMGEEGRQRAEGLEDQARNQVERVQARSRVVIDEQRGRFQKAIGQAKEVVENKREELAERL